MSVKSKKARKPRATSDEIPADLLRFDIRRWFVPDSGLAGIDAMTAAWRNWHRAKDEFMAAAGLDVAEFDRRVRATKNGGRP